jgi:hypothetical protein
LVSRRSVPSALPASGTAPWARRAVGPMTSRVSTRMPNQGDGPPELHSTDPDGLRIQLEDAGHCGGGYLGSGCPHD